MGAPLTLLSAASSTPLAKEFSQEGVTPYPHVKRVNSFHFETDISQDGLRERLGILQEHARFGYCMLKGTLKKELRNETRAGQTQRDALTSTLVLDVDGYPLDDALTAPCTADDLRAVAEHVVSLLPEELHDVSYIAHASSSFGMKPNSASVHLEFMLTQPVAPAALKLWIQMLNLDIEAFEQKLSLTPSGHTIHWLLDPSVADNSKIIYIAKPRFNGVDNPFSNDDDRWILVEKQHASVDLTTQVGAHTRAAVSARTNKKLAALRRAQGLPARNHKTRKIKLGNASINVISDPNEMNIQLYRVTGEYAIFDINGGDSHAYWCSLSNPDIMYNFKGEPPFQFSKADPEAFDAFMEEYGERVTEHRPIEPFVFRDSRTDRHFFGRYDRRQGAFVEDGGGRVALNAIARANIDDAMAEAGGIMPDVIPTYALVFNPEDNTVVDPINRTVNKFCAPPLMRDVPEIDDAFKNVTYDMSKGGDNGIMGYLNALTPNIHRLIYHVVGNDPVCYEHFINWLAHAYQYRCVSSTAWVFSGMPGTGKGVLFTRVVEAIWSREYASLKNMKNLEDNFNGSLETQLMVAFDEVHLTSGRNPERLLNDIKHMIGSDTGTVRAMRTDQQNSQFYYNFFLFSNHRDAIPIEPGDRRMNVAPYQEIPIKKQYPHFLQMLDAIDDEVPHFAAFLHHFTVNVEAARTCLENAAKAKMRFSGLNSYELFFDAVKTGKLDYFIECVLLHAPDATDYAEIQRIANAKRVIKAWIDDANNARTTVLPLDDLRLVYLAMYPHNTITPNKFGSMVNKNNLDVKRRSLAARGKLRCVETDWVIDEFADEGSQTVIQRELERYDATVH
jgi:hypothetical protein